MREKKMCKNIRKISVLALAAGICALGAGCSATEPQASEYEANIAVSVLEIKKDFMETSVRNTASVVAHKEIIIIPRAAGIVETVNFDIGDSVSEGDVLFTIDDTDLRLQVAQAEAGYQSARANYDRTVGGGAQQQLLQLESAVNGAKIRLDDAQLMLERTQALYDIGAASQKALEDVQSGYSQLLEQYTSAADNLALTQSQLLPENEATVAAAMKQAKAAYDMALRQLSHTTVKADIDGVVGMRELAEGAMVGQTSPVMSVIDISKVVLEFGVADTVISHIKAGETKVEIEIASLGSRVYTGVVRAVAPAADARTMMYTVKIEIDNEDQSIKPGMFASIKTVLQKIDDVITVPRDAITEKGGHHYVYIVQDNKAIQREVALGISNETVTQLLEGVQEGETVVIRGQNLLEDGIAVTVVENP